METLKYWIWLSLSCTPGAETFKKLIMRFASPVEVYDAEDEDIAACIGSKSSDYNLLIDKDLKKANKILDFCIKKEVGILTFDDIKYPNSLKSISNPPVLLYYRGKLPDFNSEFFVSVVGTRRLSEYGRKNAFSISRDLARAGAVIVSGMAIGIDGVAHAGALSDDKITVAVLGCGIDVCYPKQHLRLAREIVKNGCVITEFCPGTRPLRHHFPIRNRIISALSPAVLVIEGKEKSGALITARSAFSQGRVVYALPGNVGNVNSELTNLLIKNGAKLCTCADDIVYDFDASAAGKLNPFVLSQHVPIDMFEVLSDLSVSAVSQGDRIFKIPRGKRSKTNELSKKSSTENPLPQNSTSSEADLSGFDQTVVKIYKKIPVGTECAVESLIDDDLSLREVMKGLLKLEMGRFITMLPGEKVRRNF